MAWNKKPTEGEATDIHWKPSRKEAEILSEKLKGFPKREVNGRMQYPFELYCEKEGLLSFDRHGDIMVKNAFGYARAIETNSLKEWLDQKDMEQLFATFPGERAAYELRLEPIKKQIRALFSGLKEKSLIH